MTSIAPNSPTITETKTTYASPLSYRPGRWIDGWNAENTAMWENEGRSIARRNLWWSISAEFLGFVVWQLWSIVVVMLPRAGFDFSSSQIFWLISLPSLVGATFRIPYTFAVPRFGGRNWTIFSAAVLLIPTIGLGVAVSNPDTPFGVMLLIAALAGFGGGNFASSMSNISFFYPQKEKGWALGLNAAGGNLGASVAQFTVPILVTIGAVGTVNLSLAGFVWVPFILITCFGAYKYMNNLSSAKSDVKASLAAIKEPHMWILSLLYIGTFGSFIGFASVFPKLIADQFPNFSTFQIGSAAVSLAFLGALVGSVARPYGGKFSDKFGGSRITVACFAAMALLALSVIWTMPSGNFWVFLALFLCLFTVTGIGNGATYRMIPAIFVARTGKDAALSGQRKAAAAIGFISAIGAYGGFLIPQVLNLSKTHTGSYTNAFYGFVTAYLVFMLITFFVYVRPRGALAGHRI